MKKNQQLLAAGLLIFVSRLPFLFDGYGSEEDAWALRLVAERIATTGIYEVSRLPGHPFQELIYAFCWQGGSVLFNFLTAFLSTMGIIYFIKTLSRLEVKNALLAGCLLAVVPIVYINSTNAMDYTWAMAFTLISFERLCSGKPLAAGIFLALATGCRITSAVFGLPFLLFIFWFQRNEFAKASMRFIFSSVFFTLLLFIPVIKNYGFSFFTYYEHFPIPGFSKNFYKGVIAVWGIPFLSGFVLAAGVQYRKGVILGLAEKKLLLLCGLVLLLVTLLFIQVPLKAAFMIPLVPFVILASALVFDRQQLWMLFVAALISCFFFGVNLDDAKRGSARSAVSYSFRVSNQPVVFDLLNGLVMADRSKRLQRTAFSRQVIQSAQRIKEKAVVIAGWWQADILVLEKQSAQPSGVLWRYYTEEDSLKYFSDRHYAIYFLPEQERYNDLRFRKAFTLQYAEPFPLLP